MTSGNQAESGTKLGSGMRWLLLACGPLNIAGALCFSPPMKAARQAFQIPDSNPFYLWILSSWILAFGAAYFWQGWTGQANRIVLALGAWGKLTFAWQTVMLGAEINSVSSIG